MASTFSSYLFLITFISIKFLSLHKIHTQQSSIVKSIKSILLLLKYYNSSMCLLDNHFLPTIQNVVLSFLFFANISISRLLLYNDEYCCLHAIAYSAACQCLRRTYTSTDIHYKLLLQVKC